MRRWALLAVLLIVAAVVAVTLWNMGDRVAGRTGEVTSVGEAAIGGPFALTDQFGRPRTDRDYAGHFMLVYFGYTNCPDVCPTTLSVIADALEKMGGAAQQVAPVFITVDPERDTPAVLKSYLAAFGPSFVGLTGPQTSIDLAVREYHVYVRRHPPVNGQYVVDHSNVIYLMGPNGKFIANFDETEGPEKLAKDILDRMG